MKRRTYPWISRCPRCRLCGGLMVLGQDKVKEDWQGWHKVCHDRLEDHRAKQADSA